MTDQFDEDAYRERLLKSHPMNPLTMFGNAVRYLASRISDNYLIEEIEGAHPLDKIIKITTPGVGVPDEIRADLEAAAKNYLPIGYRCTFEFSSAELKPPGAT